MHGGGRCEEWSRTRSAPLRGVGSFLLPLAPLRRSGVACGASTLFPSAPEGRATTRVYYLILYTTTARFTFPPPPELDDRSLLAAPPPPPKKKAPESRSLWRFDSATL